MLNFNPASLASKKIILVVTTMAFLGLSAAIVYQKHQKKELREDIIKLNMQIVASEASYTLCLTKIDKVAEDHNAQLLKQVEKTKLNTQILKTRISEFETRLNVESNKVLIKTDKIVEKYDWSAETPPTEILEALNENF